MVNSFPIFEMREVADFFEGGQIKNNLESWLSPLGKKRKNQIKNRLAFQHESKNVLTTDNG